MDKISVVVPVYNVERYIRKCIKSILRQSHENIELILVDDGSPDNCGKICDAFSREDDRIKVIHQENAGVCAARNAAMKEVTGDYIGFVDPDDYIETDMFEYLLKGLKDNDADVSCCGYNKVLKKETRAVVCEDAPCVVDGAEAIRRQLSSGYIKSVFWNKLFKKELFDGIVFPEGVIYEGTIMVHKIFAKCDKVALLPEAKYYYVDNEESYVNDKSIKNQLDYLNAQVERYNDLIEDFPDLQQRMMNRIIREVNVLTKLCYIYKNKYQEFVPGFAAIAGFLRDNAGYIDDMKWRSAATPFNIAFVKDPGSAALKKAHDMQKKYDGEKDRKVTEELEAASKRVIRKKKMRTNVEDLTKEDKVIFDRLHDEEIEIMDEFVRICDKYGLKYYLYGGTLLGAVRHKGFIPWDDDIDIVMVREDYDKFGEIAQKELGDKYFYQTNATDPELPYLYTKIRKNNTLAVEEKFRNANMHQGIFIDILPLDHFPEVPDRMRNRLLGDFNVLNAACQSNILRSNRRKNKIKYKILKMLPNSVAQKKREKYIRSLAGPDAPYVCSFGSHYRPLVKRVFPAWWFTDAGLTMEFEGKQYTVPKGWKEYLIHLYGESYMEWPPVDKRVNHFNYFDINFDTTKENQSGEV